MEGRPTVELNRLQTWEAEMVERANGLRKEIDERLAALHILEEKIELLRRLISLDGVANEASGSLLTTAPTQKEESTLGFLAEVEDSVESLLRSAKEPMHISEIRRQLIEQGANIPGRGDEANIIVRLRKQPDRFTRTSRGTYGLSEWGIPEMQSATRRKPRSGRSTK